MYTTRAPPRDPLVAGFLCSSTIFYCTVLCPLKLCALPASPPSSYHPSVTMIAFRTFIRTRRSDPSLSHLATSHMCPAPQADKILMGLQYHMFSGLVQCPPTYRVRAVVSFDRVMLSCATHSLDSIRPRRASRQRELTARLIIPVQAACQRQACTFPTRGRTSRTTCLQGSMQAGWRVLLWRSCSPRRRQ